MPGDVSLDYPDPRVPSEPQAASRRVAALERELASLNHKVESMLTRVNKLDTWASKIAAEACDG